MSCNRPIFTLDSPLDDSGELGSVSGESLSSLGGEDSALYASLILIR